MLGDIASFQLMKFCETYISMTKNLTKSSYNVPIAYMILVKMKDETLVVSILCAHLSTLVECLEGHTGWME